MKKVYLAHLNAASKEITLWQWLFKAIIRLPMNPASTIQNSRLDTPECHLDWFQWTIDGRFVPSLFVDFFLFHDTNLLRHISQQSSLPPMLLSTLSSKYARIVLQTEKICVITQASWLQGTSKASSGKWIKLTSRKTITYYFRARNNGRSTDNVRTDWGVDQSTFRLAGHVDWSQSIVLKMKSVVSIVISM